MPALWHHGLGPEGRQRTGPKAALISTLCPCGLAEGGNPRSPHGWRNQQREQTSHGTMQSFTRVRLQGQGLDSWRMSHQESSWPRRSCCAGKWHSCPGSRQCRKDGRLAATVPFNAETGLSSWIRASRAGGRWLHQETIGSREQRTGLL